MHKGKVYLVGAGPGDLGLITVKGLACLKQAEVIICDYLVNSQFLLLASAGAEKIYLGEEKRSQEDINELLIKKAREGKKVVRLKGGDPFIFGRGGEEAEALSRAKIEFEIIPGISSALAVPAYAGIPLTQRGITSTLGLITGHEDPDKKDSDINWSQISPGLGTLVFLMAVKNLPQIVKRLLENEWDRETPVALIRQGTLPEQETFLGTLATIVEEVRKRKIQPPAVLVVGKVVKLREKIKWFENKPLFGRKIIITRAFSQSHKLSRPLEEAGAEVIEFPVLNILPPENYTDLDEAIANLKSYHWVIFTSENGVNYFFRRLKAQGKDARSLFFCRICALGEVTAGALEKFGLNADLVPLEYSSRGIINKMSEENLSGNHVLIPRAEVAPAELPDGLKKLGAEVKVVSTYRTVKADNHPEEFKKILNQKMIDLLTFTSASSVKNFIESFAEKELTLIKEKIPVAVIGPLTARAAEEAGFKVVLQPEHYTVSALIGAIINHFSK